MIRKAYELMGARTDEELAGWEFVKVSAIKDRNAETVSLVTRHTIALAVAKAEKEQVVAQNLALLELMEKEKAKLTTECEDKLKQLESRHTTALAEKDAAHKNEIAGHQAAIDAAEKLVGLLREKLAVLEADEALPAVQERRKAERIAALQKLVADAKSAEQELAAMKVKERP